MAGKHTAVYQNDAAAAQDNGFEWNPKTSKAYAEGRAGSAPSPADGGPAQLAWERGNAFKADPDQQFETAGEVGAATKYRYNFSGNVAYAVSATQLVEFDTTVDYRVEVKANLNANAGTQTLFAPAGNSASITVVATGAIRFVDQTGNQLTDAGVIVAGTNYRVVIERDSTANPRCYVYNLDVDPNVIEYQKIDWPDDAGAGGGTSNAALGATTGAGNVADARIWDAKTYEGNLTTPKYWWPANAVSDQLPESQLGTSDMTIQNYSAGDWESY